MIGDSLKKFRSSGYAGKMSEDKDEKFSDDKPNEKPRIIALTNDEKQAFAGAKPGEDVGCEVHGSLEADGHFHVLSVAPLRGEAGYGDEQEMARQVAQRVTPGSQLSLS